MELRKTGRYILIAPKISLHKTIDGAKKRAKKYRFWEIYAQIKGQKNCELIAKNE